MGQEFVRVNGKKYYVEDEALDLSNLRIKDIKEIKGLDKLTNLQELSLGGNLIKEIQGLEDLTSLRELDLYRNQIEKIKGLDNLTNLRALYLSKNRIKKIERLDTLCHLQELYLKDNKVGELEGLDTLTNLQELNLSHNQISRIKGLEHLANLKHLDLSENPIDLRENVIREDEWIELECLDEIRLVEIGRRDGQKIVRYCQAKVKNEFMTFRGKKYYNGGIGVYYPGDCWILDSRIKGPGDDEAFGIDLSSKEITDIDEIKGLEILTEIKWLELNDNQIKEIKGLEELTNLQYLRLSRNQIEELKGLESLTNLQELYLRQNRITEIKGLENLKNLKKINLAFNKIKEIKGLGKLTKLEYLSLRKNEIKEIKGLENLKNLRKLYLSYNEIREIMGLENLTNLRKLDLTGNPIRKDEWDIALMKVVNEEWGEYCEGNVYEQWWDAPDIVKYCKEKKLGKIPFVTVGGEKYYVYHEKGVYYRYFDNTFSPVDEDFDYHDKLDLSNLGITEINEIKGLENLTSLQELCLGNNQITEIKGLGNLTNLKKLDLSKNPIREDERYLMDKNAQEIVKYCQEKAKKAQEGG